MPLPSPGPTVSRTLYEWWARGIAGNGFVRTLRIFITEILDFLRDSTPEQRRRRYGDVEYDWDHHVDTTSATVGWRDRFLGAFHSPYQPTEPTLFHEMLARLDIDLAGLTFIDLGSGKGRTLLMASEYPFHRIVGVELLTELHRVATKNLGNYQSESQKCRQIETLCGDACEFQFPAEPTVLYLFNPFPPARLTRVLENLKRSLKENPRAVFVLYHNPLYDELILGSKLFQKHMGTEQYTVYANLPTKS
jgi:SAM-dependent methyltransferase